MERAIRRLTILAALSSIISAGIGVFYTNGGVARTVQNLYGQTVTLYGDGVYANNSLLKVGATKGADVVMILTGVILLVLVFGFMNKKWAIPLRAGLISLMLYASTCLIMGVSFNQLFPLYLVQFGCALFAFILSTRQLLSMETYKKEAYDRSFKGTGIFLIVSACSVLVWLTSIVPAVLTGSMETMETLEIYTTEPTFVIDLAIIFPSALFSGIMLLKRKKIGYQLAPIMLTLLAGVGACVIFQTVFHTSLGIILPIGQLIGFVGSFIILGVFATALNFKLLRYAKPNNGFGKNTGDI